MVIVMLYHYVFYIALSMDLFFLRIASNISNYLCGCYFVVECHGGVQCGIRGSFGQAMHGLQKRVCVVP